MAVNPASDPRPKMLLASVHDVTPAHEARLDALVPRVAAATCQGRFALLVVPNFHGEAPLRSGSAFARRLQAWSDDGCEIFLHGLTHRDDSAHQTFGRRLKAERLTAGEGEFLGLSLSDARHRLRAGRACIEDIIGREVDGFIAPAWLYGADARQAIAELGFALCEDHFRVWQPASGRIVARGPVVTYATRSRGRILSSIAWSRAATTLLRPARVVRHAVHPHDVDRAEILSEAMRALRAFSVSHRASAYRDLLH